jgi:hypothetical protein
MNRVKKTDDSESNVCGELVDRKSADWKTYIHGFIDNVEKELRPSAPPKSRAALNEFRTRINRDHVKRRRKRFQNDLDKLLETDPVLHAATNRFMKKLLRETTKKLKISLKSIRASVKVLKSQKLARERAASKINSARN